MNTANQKKPTLVLCGFMASGKTTLGVRLARELGYAFADTDEMLLRETQMTLAEMFAIGGEAYFRDREHEIIRKAAQLRHTVISTGGGVMTFDRNARLLAEHAEIIHIHRDFDACYASIKRRKDRPIAGQKSEDDMRRMYNARLAAYEKYASFTLHNDGTQEEALDQLMRWLRA